MEDSIIFTTDGGKGGSHQRGLCLVHGARDMAEAARLYARARDLGLDAMNEAAEIKLLAERKAGEMLAGMDMQKPGQYQQRSSRTTVAIPPKLADLGITYDQSSQWQTIASIPEPEFTAIVEETKAADKPLATKTVVTEAKKRQKQAATERANRPPSSAPEPETTPIQDRQAVVDANLCAAEAEQNNLGYSSPPEPSRAEAARQAEITERNFSPPEPATVANERGQQRPTTYLRAKSST